MYSKIFLTTALGLFVGGNLKAQDKIFLANGNVTEAKVKTVTANAIIYKLWSNQDGPEYSVRKSEVDKIKYMNGSEEKFEDNAHVQLPQNLREVREGGEGSTHRKMALKNNLICISPFQFTENGVGFSFNYEGGIDKEGAITYNFPIIATFNLNNHQDYYGNNINSSSQDPMVYFSPGLKFYPTSCYGRVKYAIGPSLVVGAGQHTTYSDFYNQTTQSYSYSETTQTKFILGIILTNSLNVNATKHFYFGADLGLGFTYINRLGGVNQGITGIVQGGFRVGYRF